MKTLTETRDELIKIRTIWDFDQSKAKKILTNLIKELGEVSKK